MEYLKICEVYSALEATTKGLEKTTILANFLSEIEEVGEYDLIYLLRGRVFADYDSREFGISGQLAIRAIARVSGVDDSEVVKIYRVLGDLGKTAEELSNKKRQSSLFSSKLTVEKVLTNLRKLPDLEGKGTVDKKIGLVVELLNSAEPVEAKYIVRTVLGDLKVGVGNGLLRDSIVENCFHPNSSEEKKECVEKVQAAYDKTTDFAEVFEKACKKKLKEIRLSPGKPVKVMLFPKAENVEDAFRIVGRPAAFEFKYDGFRVMINKEENGEIRLFTRRLEDVSNQFPDVVEFVEKNVKGKSFILDSEIVGYDPETKEYKEFQAISQRIRRKHHIERLVKELPVEIKVFDIIYYEGESLIKMRFEDRRKFLEKIVGEKDKEIALADQIVTSKDEDAEEFFNKALEENQEGLMVKSLEAPYKPGSRIGHAVKLKPEDKDFDLVITGAEWGTGKRAGWLTSFDVSCRDENGELMEIGKVSTGLKEKDSEGLSFKELTRILKKEIEEESGRKVSVSPRVVVTVRYQNIQKSPTYSSGFALRFPRITRIRPDRNVEDIATLEEIESEAGK